jgi:hypothetical protein
VTSPADVLPTTIFVLTRPLAELPDTLRLPSLDWSLLFAVSGRHTVHQIGARFGVSPAARDAAFARLLDAGLIVESPLTVAEFQAARARVDAEEPVTLAAFLADEPPFVPLEPTPPEDAMAAVIPLVSRRRLSLRNLMANLSEGAATPEEGQMNVYRLFLRLDSNELQRHGIKTLRFEDDRFVDDPDLQEQILAAYQTTFRKPCPASVFV